MKYIDKFYIMGINFEDSKMKDREDYLESNPKDKLEKLYRDGIIQGYVFIKTCLRVELAVYADDYKQVYDVMSGKNMYTKKGKEAIRYLFSVICGLKSVIIGEEQILSQVKSSFLKHLTEKRTNGEINVIFNHAIALGKRFRDESQINCRPLSLENIAVKFMEEHFGDLSKKRIFLVGTGNLSQSILYILKSSGIENIIITNRSSHKTQAVEMKYNVDTVDFKYKYDTLKESDIIVSATSAPHSIFKKEKLTEIVSDERGRFFLDLAMPRDIESPDRAKKSCFYNLDDLWREVEKNREKRCKISRDNYHLVDQEVEDCVDWFKRREIYG